MKKKSVFEMPKAEIILFGKDDIITTSGGSTGDGIDSIELPIDFAAINISLFD